MTSSSSPDAKTTPSIIHMEWRDGAAADVACPNCGSRAARHRLYLRLSSVRLPEAHVYECSDCTCCYFAPYTPLDYGATGRSTDASLAYYIQQGANPFAMARLLQRLGTRPGARMLEIGSSFGLALDFARHALGWSVVGYDPSPFAAEGRRLLGADIRSEYFRGVPPEGEPYDVLLCSEVVEHVEDPVVFLRQMGEALRDDGALVLTTPAADALEPGTSPGALVPLLSPGAHHVLQSAASLERALRAAGFAQAQVERDGASLVAWASRSGTPWRAPTPADLDGFRRYLVDRAGGFEAQSDLRLGFLARAYRIAVGCGDLPTAEALWSELDQACRERYGLDLEKGPSMELESLRSLARAQPLFLGAVLLSRAHQLISSGRSRADVAGLLQHSIRAAELFRGALRRVGADDGETELAEWTARAELALLQAERGDEDAIAALRSVCASPLATPERAERLRGRAFVGLVNAGQYDRAFATGVRPDDVVRRLLSGPAADPQDIDVAFCFATAALNTGDPDSALRVVETLRPTILAHAPHLSGPLEALVRIAVAQTDASAG